MALNSPTARADHDVDVIPDLVMQADDRLSDHRICVRTIRRHEPLRKATPEAAQDDARNPERMGQVTLPESLRAQLGIAPVRASHAVSAPTLSYK
jgi:hypothetical protein